MEQDASNELEMTKSRALNKFLNMKLTTLTLSALLASVEISRKKIHNALVNFKTETLIEKRTQIKVLEKEIEKFSTERDALEETRVGAFLFSALLCFACSEAQLIVRVLTHITLFWPRVLTWGAGWRGGRN